MARIIHYKAKGTTLVESLVALTILMVVFAIGMVIFVNITKTRSKNLYYLAKSKSLEIAFQTKKDRLFFDDEMEEDNLKFIRTVSFYNQKEYLLWINIKAVNSSGGEIYHYNELILDEEYNK